MQHDGVRAVLFDLDGTLADTIGDIASSVNSVLSRHGFPLHDTGSYRSMVGNGFANLMRRALPAAVVDDSGRFDFLAAEASSLYRRNSLATTKPFPGIVPLLQALAAKGIVMAVLSNKPDPMTREMVAALFPDIAFAAVSGERPGVPRKPDPAGALAIAASAGIPPAAWAFVGDSDVDMLTGRAAGMMPIGAAWGYRSLAELRAAGAAAILSLPSELLDHIR